MQTRYSRLKNPSVVLCSLVCTLMMTSAALSQTTGGVKGKVRGMRGEKIASATITARQNGRDVRSATSNSKGEFALTGLTPGAYNIVFDAKGYASGIKYNVEVRSGKTIDLGDRLILQTDQGTMVIVRGSVFDKEGRSISAAKIEVEKIGSDGSARKVATVWSDISGEFVFRQPEGPAKFRMTATFRDHTASKEIEVDSAAVYRLAISLDLSRSEK